MDILASGTEFQQTKNDTKTLNSRFEFKDLFWTVFGLESLNNSCFSFFWMRRETKNAKKEKP